MLTIRKQFATANEVELSFGDTNYFMNYQYALSYLSAAKRLLCNLWLCGEMFGTVAQDCYVVGPA